MCRAAEGATAMRSAADVETSWRSWRHEFQPRPSGSQASTASTRKESNESPLLYFTRNQATKLNDKIGNKKIIVDYAMRYGNPSIKSRLDKLKEDSTAVLLIGTQNKNGIAEQRRLFIEKYTYKKEQEA